MEEMNGQTTGEKASIFPGKSAADILAASEEKKSHSLIGTIYEHFVGTERNTNRAALMCQEK